MKSSINKYEEHKEVPIKENIIKETVENKNDKNDLMISKDKKKAEIKENKSENKKKNNLIKFTKETSKKPNV